MTNTSVSMVKKALHWERIRVNPPPRKDQLTNNCKFTDVKIVKNYSFTFFSWLITIEVFNQRVKKELNNTNENFTMSLFNILITIV